MHIQLSQLIEIGFKVFFSFVNNRKIANKYNGIITIIDIKWKVGENFLRKLNSSVEELNRGRLETRLRRSFNMQTWHKLLFHAKNVHAATFGSFINRPRARLAILQRNIRPGRRRFHN
ncbi:Neurotensin receptor type [Trichinella spiralis]|uniref:Neurotensin receptor type n=2 Tax=Trichinella spiralis TaxID=6334 RepID=A0ABR3KYX6_TRISP|nr:hypothetical protein T01_11877 [Trichinella spiralis]